jgi:hypothetical protein
MSYLLEPEEPEPDDEEAPLPLEAPPDWPWMLPEALAPVPPLSMHSFGMSAREAYFVASQRVSFWGTCVLLGPAAPTLDAVPLVPLVVAPLEVGADCMPLVVLGAPEPDGCSADWVVVVVDEAFFSLARSPRARTEPLARAKRVVNNTTGVLLRIGILQDELVREVVRVRKARPRCSSYAIRNMH